MARRDLVVVGASAGGVEALRTLAASLPVDFPAAVLVVLHIPAGGVGALAAILDRAGPLTCRTAVHGEPLALGEIRVAPPDQHLLVVDDATALSRRPRENGHRPAVDPLFRSAARAHGEQVVAVVLSGALDDGTAGMAAVRRLGGVGVVQDPDEALHAGMPRNAMATEPEFVVPVAKMPQLLLDLVTEELPDADPDDPAALADQGVLDRLDSDVAEALMDQAALDDPEPGVPSNLTCPDCHGPLSRIVEGKHVRFRCRVGHAWSVQSLLAQQGVALEGALWMALRSLEEKADLCRQMAHRAREDQRPLTAAQFTEQADEALHAAHLLRELLLEMPGREVEAG